MCAAAKASNAYLLKLPNSAARTTDIRAGCFAYFARHYGDGWHEEGRIIKLPAMIRCDWEGPVGEAAGSIRPKSSEDTTMRENAVKKYATEYAVFSALAEQLAAVGSGGIIVNGPKLSRATLEVLNQMLGTCLATTDPFANLKAAKRLNAEGQSSDKQKETDSKNEKELSDAMLVGVSDRQPKQGSWTEKELTDVVLVSQEVGVVVMEVKPSPSEFAKAHGEVANAGAWTESLLKEMAVASHESCCPQVHPMIILPTTSVNDLEIRFYNRDKFIYLTKEDFDLPEGPFANWWHENAIAKEVRMSDEMYTALAATFLVLRTAKFTNESLRIEVAEEHLSRRLNIEHGLNAVLKQSLLKPIDDKLQQEASFKAKQEKAKRKAQNNGAKMKASAAPGSAQTKPPKQKETVQISQGWAPDGFSVAKASTVPTPQRTDSVDAGFDLFQQLMFLTPEQDAIFNSPLPQQVIEGYASTGKTILVQNKILSLFAVPGDTGTSVIVLVPPYLTSYYMAFLRRNLADFEKLCDQRRLRVIDLAEFAQLSIAEVEAAHIYRDEFGASYSCYDDDVLRSVTERLMCALRSGRCYWTTLDRSQYHTSRLELVTSTAKADLRSDAKDERSKAQTLKPLCDLEEEFPKGIYAYLTSALRCSIQVFTSWKDQLASKLLQQGHNVAGPEPQIRRFARRDYTTAYVCKTVCAEVDKAISDDGWFCEDIAVIILDTDKLQPPKLLSCLSESLARSHKITETGKRELTSTALTLDYATNTFSHEWPVVITVACQDTHFVPETLTYIARTRCLSQLIVIEHDDHAQFNLEKMLRSKMDPNLVFVEGALFIAAQAIKPKRCVTEYGFYRTMHVNRFGDDCAQDILLARTMNCARLLQGFTIAMNAFDRFAGQATTAIDALALGVARKLQELLMRCYFQCVEMCRNDSVLQTIEHINTRIKFEEQLGNRPRELLMYDGDYDAEWSQVWKRHMGL